jgi:GNAT superfamily N-acetyltransferase
MTVVPLTEHRFDEFVDLLRALADYERLDPPDAAAIERLRRDAFGTGTPDPSTSSGSPRATSRGEGVPYASQPRFEAALALNSKGKAVGYATWFHTYSTFLAKPTMYLEDLFVRDDSRESGAGSALFEHVRTLGAQRDCGRMEWQVLDWNTLAREFYHRRQATWMKDWLTYRITY